ncbi:hypothetical protein LTR36_007086 [Oleoguttula mirabilis]|uniref:N-acetyltransferase domain-containing protein n=1 Tax=Oleoguttula mirabilis TaxID=1507867 RepID=A0AAV9JAX9_9PEZI|nr:hypothetical protein LTR36_007086 [Oleoguttula mirabilis]
MFETNRLLLRGVDPDADLTTLMQWFNDAERSTLMISGPIVPTSREQAKAAFQPRPDGLNLPFFAICEKQADRTYPLQLEPGEDYIKACGPAIGLLNFQPKAFDYKNRIATLGLTISDVRHRGKGYGREVLEWGLEYAFMELGLHRMSLEMGMLEEEWMELREKLQQK